MHRGCCHVDCRVCRRAPRGGITGFDPALWSVDASGFLNDTSGELFEVLEIGNGLYLGLVAVPEPSELMLAAAGLAGLGCVALRRRLGSRRQGV